MKNVVSNIDMGYSIPNLKRLVNTIAHIFNIESEIFIMPLRVKELDENAYVVSSINSFIIYVNELYLRKDKVSDFMIRMFIHEMWHVKQMADKRLSFNQEHTRPIGMALNILPTFRTMNASGKMKRDKQNKNILNK